MSPPAFPPAPLNTIDWNNVGFKVREVNGHIECHFSKKVGKWTEPKWVVDPYLKIHGMAPGLNYGVQCYEGMKAYRSPDDKHINIFRPNKNAERMQHSASYVSIPPVPTELFIKSVDLAVAMNAEHVPPHSTGAAMYIRPLLFGSSAQLGLNPPEEYTFVVFVMPTGVYHGTHPVPALILEEFDRTAPFGTGSAKIGGNYGPVLRWSEKARNDGYGITLHLDSKTRSEIDEFSTSAFIAVRGNGDSNTTLVYPESKNIVDSVTGQSCLDMARSFGWKVEVRQIKYEELPTFDEIIAGGTAAALVPIRSITMESRGDKFVYQNDSEELGPVVSKLLATLKGIQQAKIKDTFGWIYTVNDPKEFAEQQNASHEVTNGYNGNVDKLP
ncbi:branched-chain amino acid aminotransferase [Rhizodiscina lignyota]|uniref:Branched-chain amino acid aminotransferase n=1 Tax=Rhizodiscina lignyota TaxID=1504668 RepID=A0A9P4I563_9PEZI|nr:branched-chain amino acid aminotransferase [Rhizodiscina lignyota]